MKVRNLSLLLMGALFVLGCEKDELTLKINQDFDSVETYQKSRLGFYVKTKNDSVNVNSYFGEMTGTGAFKESPFLANRMPLDSLTLFWFDQYSEEDRIEIKGKVEPIEAIINAADEWLSLRITETGYVLEKRYVLLLVNLLSYEMEVKFAKGTYEDYLRGKKVELEITEKGLNTYREKEISLVRDTYSILMNPMRKMEQARVVSVLEDSSVKISDLELEEADLDFANIIIENDRMVVRSNNELTFKLKAVSE